MHGCFFSFLFALLWLWVDKDVRKLSLGFEIRIIKINNSMSNVKAICYLTSFYLNFWFNTVLIFFKLIYIYNLYTFSLQ